MRASGISEPSVPGPDGYSSRYSVPTGLNTFAAAEVVEPEPQAGLDGQRDLDLVAVQSHAGYRSHLDSVDCHDVACCESAGAGEIGVIGGVVVDQGEFREFESADDQNERDDDPDQSRKGPVPLAETPHEQLAV